MAREDLADWKRTNLADGMEFFLSLKSFDLEGVRRRYLASLERDKRGSIEWRPPTMGGVVRLRRGYYEVKETPQEVRGLAWWPNGGVVYAMDTEVRGAIEIKHPHFSHLHSLDTYGERVMVCSSGYDALLEFNLNGDLVWSHYFTEPGDEPVPAGKRKAFINTATYTGSRSLLITAFHEGAVYRFDMVTRERELIRNGMLGPHGGMWFRDMLLVTDTQNGRVFVGQTEYDFSKLAGAEDQWLQTTRPVGDLLVTVDSNRTSLVVWDLIQKCYDVVKYPHNWAVQDVLCSA